MFALLIQDPKNYVENPAKPPVIDGYGQLPKLASTFGDVDGLFYFTYAVCIFFFFLILGVLLFSCVKYRRKTFDQPAASNTTHNTPLEVVWTVIPLIIVMVMFAWGFKGCLDMTTVPIEAKANTYKASAKQWEWFFTYPDGTTSSNEVWLQVDKPLQFYLESSDVLHAFYVPSMRVKRDVIPGRFQAIWFHPKEVGDYHLFCAEYCGKDHSRMYAQVHVVEAAVFAKKPWDTWEDKTEKDAIASAQKLFAGRCSSCHTVGDKPGTAPSWKGLFTKQGDKIVGRQRDVIEGGAKKTITVDEDYIRESIAEPAKKIAAEFPAGGMSDFADLDPKRASNPALAKRKVDALILYMKSLQN